MAQFCVVKTGGKQYVATEKDFLVVDRMDAKEKDKIELETLAVFDEKGDINLGAPNLPTKTEATVIEHLKGEKLRISKFKAKVRYRRVTGFRSKLTKIQITKIPQI
ncbi:50S ribosomal protein L21 [Candidatus Roizmanbacteria bacterium RIFOXYB2_FULL_38_10]|uniref:Large ribosomal subunit protein bL21 n=1 Tax=Candidatus Roizmanbacteria bacterium RIFOXYD1_FULL_38_12 TaxID=1802093 RepID=A0A1F7L0E8_9BACT|nr:MAG: 50S ribosomal protein L21 [Candidatus Roizmanbacteria bacterium RIFOXYA2_FULL_38_14]OGK63543.1 MAG: 50S ribosomal protein L21 [Candidatus Roizmanbacteria bacterium RIFOXYA1_FULL_37_12]OGK65389.1 MAG: 50S ribosomal protein L21 [Candidatus Roizmanbacteria bacterium RIFOXYB1_FULL_40_23]OGK69135.1 MAG: 50S ribosomal protein L21 [Candidatus Roizmanbacteria bacterium RIFOXYB2_FULL_38_10]OGK69794.1 MAG: 50S ribosomal protein L21 [Candidatus Roizmanbacteria bacterium RIFOXYC1_FULL_38_14]OGK724